MVGQMKHILTTEQKKTDFRPEDENNVMIQYTTVREHSKLSKSNAFFCDSTLTACWTESVFHACAPT